MKGIVIVAAATLLTCAGVRAEPVEPAGAQLFAQNCAACHQANGKGIPGAFPALAGDGFVTGDPTRVAMTLLNGRGGMPSFRDALDDAQLAAVESYIRGGWGNGAAPVAPALFATARQGTKAVRSRPVPGH